jgi:transposase
MAILTVRIDLAKNVFAVLGGDDAGEVVRKCPAMPHKKLMELVGSLPPSLTGLEVEPGNERSGGR